MRKEGRRRSDRAGAFCAATMEALPIPTIIIASKKSNESNTYQLLHRSIERELAMESREGMTQARLVHASAA